MAKSAKRVRAGKKARRKATAGVRKAGRASARDRREVAAGKGSASDRREASRSRRKRKRK